MRSFSRLAVAMVVTCSAISAQAAFVVPGIRGGVDTTYQEWNVFNTAAGPNIPDVANSNPNGNGNVSEPSGNSVVLGSGNIYAPVAAGAVFTVTVPDFNYGSGYVTNAVVQIRTQGTPIDDASVRFNGFAAESATLLYSEVLGGFGGELQDWQFVFTGFLGNLAVDTITFLASGDHMSLDRVAVDTQAVPVPEASSLVLGGIALATVVGVIRRRRVA